MRIMNQHQQQVLDACCYWQQGLQLGQPVQGQVAQGQTLQYQPEQGQTVQGQTLQGGIVGDGQVGQTYITGGETGTSGKSVVVGTAQAGQPAQPEVHTYMVPGGETQVTVLIICLLL